MEPSLHAEIRKKAYFVAGLQAWSRSSPDLRVEAAIKDAENFLAQLPSRIAQPTLVRAGTTGTPDTIVNLLWLFSGHQEIKSVAVDFIGNDECNVRWDEPNGHRTEVKNLAVCRLNTLNIDEKIKALGDPASPVRPSPPRSFDI